MLRHITQPHHDDVSAQEDVMKALEGISDYEALDHVGAWCKSNVPTMHFHHAGFHHSFGQH